MIQLFVSLLGVGFTAVGLLFVNYGLPRTATLVCERSQVQHITCHQSETVAGISTGIRRLEKVQSIQLVSFQLPSDQGDIDVQRYHIVLTGPQGQLTFGMTSNPVELQPTLEKLNRFQSESSSNSMSVSGGQVAWLHLAVGSLVTALGLWLAIAPIKTALKSKKHQT